MKFYNLKGRVSASDSVVIKMGSKIDKGERVAAKQSEAQVTWVPQRDCPPGPSHQIS